MSNEAVLEQLAIVNANKPVATGGTAQAATAVPASDDEEQTAELARLANCRVGRRVMGGRSRCQWPPARRPSPGFTLLVRPVPEHAATIRAYRQRAGGTADPAGTSTTATVSLVASHTMIQRDRIDLGMDVVS